MGIDDEIAKAVFDSNKADLRTILNYVRWVKVRRQIHHRFYFDAHWIRPIGNVHWVGR